MSKLLPILPCVDVKAQIEFYRQLGFELVERYERPNSYAVMSLDDIELHFYGSKHTPPEANASMCFIRVDDVDALHDRLTASLRERRGSVPRSGIPRVSKPRDLVADRRFTLTDVGGNTFYIGTPREKGAPNFFRDLDSEALRGRFALLYDLVYSKEDMKAARKALNHLMQLSSDASELDRAKLLLIEMEIGGREGIASDVQPLLALIVVHRDKPEWDQIAQRFQQMHE